MPLFDTSKLPFPQKGQLPKAEWFVVYSEALRTLAAAAESRLGDPLESGLFRLARTKGGTYPLASATPNVFPIKFRSLHDYTIAAGNQTVTKADRHSDSSVADDYVLNLASVSGYRHTHFIPEGQDIWCIALANRWMTWYVGGPLVHFKSGGGGLSAYNSSTGQAGSGSGVIYSTDASGAKTSLGITETILNPGPAFAANRFGVAAYNAAGVLEAIVEPCN